MAEQPLPSLGDWVDQLFNDIFFQPDDDLSTTTFEKGISRDVTIRSVPCSVHSLALIPPPS